MKRIGRWITVLAVVMVAALLVMPAGVASAQREAPTYDRLENYYQRQLLNVESLYLRLDSADLIMDHTQDIIDRLENAGIDTAELEAALDDFEAAVGVAQTSVQTADRILSEHAGFDDAGEVIDVEAALGTTRAARNAIIDAHLTLVDATIDLRLAVRSYLDDLRAQYDA